MFLFYTNPILIAAAVLPAIFLLVHVYRADKLEKEPAPLLISLVLYGIAATFIALVLERAGSFLLGLWFEEGSVAYNAIMYFGIVAFSEEGAKYFLLRRRTWHSAAFNCQFDGVVYAVFVALGFALWENISYVLMYGLSTALVRAAQEKNPDWKDGRAIFAAAEAGNETVLALLDAWTDEIAQGLAGMVHIFNPQLILIGGGVSAQQKLLIEPIAEKVKASVMPAFAEGLEIRAAQLHNDAGMVGAVYYFRQTMEKE